MLPTSHTMTRKAYKSDITDAQWQLIEALIPPAKTGGRPRTVNVREVVNG
ncbi:MAG: transposase, partial [Moorea sp. SIO2I5]|nr:transposase [Moorena sp. SIO2I5]